MFLNSFLISTRVTVSCSLLLLLDVSLSDVSFTDCPERPVLFSKSIYRLVKCEEIAAAVGGCLDELSAVTDSPG